MGSRPFAFYTAAMLAIALLQTSDIDEMVAAFRTLGWGGKDHAQYERYVLEQMEGVRSVRLARWGGAFAGYATIRWHSDYAPFAQANIPEISDFNVLPDFRRRHIGTALMDDVERLIALRSKTIGIGVGLFADYGAAQALYARRGYVPDSRGITSHNLPATYGQTVPVDDDLVLWLTKTIS